MIKHWLFGLFLFIGSLVSGQEVRTYIPFKYINELADASFNRTTGFIELAIKQKQLIAYFDSGLTEPMTVPQYDSLKIRISIDTFFNGTDTFVNPYDKISTVIYSETIGEPDFWERISWTVNHIRIQISSDRQFFFDRKKFIGFYNRHNTFFIQQEIVLKDHGTFSRDSIGFKFNLLLNGLAKMTLNESLSGKYLLSNPYQPYTNSWIFEAQDSLISLNEIRCDLFSTLALVDCDTLNLDTLSVNVIEPVITGFAISWNYQREAGSFLGKPVKIGLSYHPLIAGIELPDNPLFWMDYRDFASIATEDELEILFAVLYEFQCWQLSERYDEEE